MDLQVFVYLNLKTKLVEMTAVLHKHEITHRKCVLFTYRIKLPAAGHFLQKLL